MSSHAEHIQDAIDDLHITELVRKGIFPCVICERLIHESFTIEGRCPECCCPTCGSQTKELSNKFEYCPICEDIILRDLKTGKRTIIMSRTDNELIHEILKEKE